MAIATTLTTISLIFFNAKIGTKKENQSKYHAKGTVNDYKSQASEKELKNSMANLIKESLGALNNDKKKFASKKMIKENAQKVRNIITNKLKNRKGFGRDILDILSIADEVGLDDGLRIEVYNLISKTKKSKQKGHHISLSTEDQIRHRGLSLLFKESKKGNKKSKKMLVDLLLKKDFPNKYRVANLILKSNEKKRRATQEELKKKLPRDQHYLLYRK